MLGVWKGWGCDFVLLIDLVYPLIGLMLVCCALLRLWDCFWRRTD